MTALLLYDGGCGLCCRSVAFALRRSRPEDLAFASLDSPVGQAELLRCGFPADYRGSAVLIADGRAWARSDAAVRLAGRLYWPWRAGAALRFVPRFLRDAVYDLVARHRLRFFGPGDHCAVPRAGDRERFRDGPANGP